MKTYEVEMVAWGGGAIRPVDVENQATQTEAQLEQIFRNGQNDFQARPFPSVSVGDIVRLGDGRRFRVEPCGFEQVNA